MNKESIRAVGGIVHSDGNIFFRNQKMLDAYVAAIAQPAEPTLTDAQVKAMSEKHQAEAFEEWGQTVQPAVSDAQAKAAVIAYHDMSPASFIHPKTISDMRRALQAFAASSTLPVVSERVYQVSGALPDDPPNTWRDATQTGYDCHLPNRRRILYTQGAPAQAAKMLRHKFWGAGESDCPKDIKASNGELHTMRCKVCGDNWRKSVDVCFGATTPTEGSQST